MASPAPAEPAEGGCPAPAAGEQEPPPRGPPGERGAAAAAAGRQVGEAAGEVAAVVTWLLGAPGLWLGCCAQELLSWKRPLRTLLAFAGANLLFW